MKLAEVIEELAVRSDYLKETGFDDASELLDQVIFGLREFLELHSDLQ